MGIRYDRDSHRKADGPTVIFTDPVSMGMFMEDVARALESRLSFYAYREPGDLMMTYGVSGGFVDGLGTPGFVIAPFGGVGEAVTIPWKPVQGMVREAGLRFPFPKASTTPAKHMREVKAIVESVASHPLNKTVAATATCLEMTLDAGSTFARLCRDFPECFVFMFSTPATGCWVGASPELLLRATSSGLETVALAGTRTAGTPGFWDEKNTAEQEAVARFVCSALESSGCKVSRQPAFSKVTGKLEHICTPVTAVPAPSKLDDLSALLDRLSPTPAVCGLPREESADLIARFEDFDRGCYGGFCGPLRSPADFSFYVTLRCARFTATRVAVFAGGGVTRLSDPADEWMETRRKADAIISRLANDNKP